MTCSRVEWSMRSDVTSVKVEGGVGDGGLVRRAVETVLVVARLGEVDRCGWWGTRSFGVAGRVVLKQRLPRTWRMAAIELDIAAAANRHNGVIDRPNAVHLFSDNWPVRRWASAWVAEQKTERPPDSLIGFVESATTEELLARLGAGEVLDAPSGSAVRVGSISSVEIENAEAITRSVSALSGAYRALGPQFVVPYLEVEQ